MVGMFLIIGAVEYFFPAQPVPRRHYALNFSYGFINIFVVSAFMPVVAAGGRPCLPKGRFRVGARRSRRRRPLVCRAGRKVRLGLSAELASPPLPSQAS